MKEIEQTLAEQLQITEREIEKRKELMHIGEHESEVLRAYLPVIEGRIDSIVERFYIKQIAVSEIALVIGDAETLRRLKGAMHRYILELFSGFYDFDYVNKRLRIGKVHKRIGVSPKLYISAVWLLQETLNEEIDSTLQGNSEAEQVRRRSIKEAMTKLFMFDIQMVFDTYIASLVNEVSVAKQEMENYAASLEEQVAERTRQLEVLSREDALTGLKNQRTFYELLRHELAVAERHQDELSLIYLDLNGFKHLNDSKGHLMGDEILKCVGLSLHEAMRETDHACRYGGDEFCIILPRTSTVLAEEVIERVIDNFRKRKVEGVTFSAGIATAGPDEFVGLDALVKEADGLMYQAKAKAHKEPGFYTMTRSSKRATVELVVDKQG